MCVCLCTMWCAWCLGTEEGIGYLGTGVKESRGCHAISLAPKEHFNHSFQLCNTRFRHLLKKC